jgi:CubicO group peptidase (beta-lactamase class C family)
MPKRVWATALVAAASMLCGVAGAQPLTREDVEAFLDGAMSQRLEPDDIAGVAVAIVKDGRVLLEKGYGYADVENKVPVRADRTVFSIASISKTFVATSVMQLVELGKLQLDADVRQYLDFELERRFPEPITLRRLLTHTAGFEEGGQDNIESPNAISKLGEFLRTHQPAQIFAPGSRIAYSNYGVSLAGYIVERVSGESFAEYVERHIYAPLEMRHSTFVAPLPRSLADVASREYRFAHEPAQPIQYVPRRPAGGMFSTADDMAHYMIAHLQNGRYGDARILQEASAQTLHSVQWRGHPSSPGIALTFYQDAGNGRFVLTHGGDLARQHSELWLVPAENLGVFIAFNTTGTDWIRLRAFLWKQFIDRYLPPLDVAEPASPTANADAVAVAGTYLSTRRPDTSLLSIFYHLAPTRVSVNPDRTISVEGLDRYDGTPRTFHATGYLAFRETGNTGATVAFLRNSQGRVNLMLIGAASEFERQTGLLNGTVQRWLLLSACCVVVAAVLIWPLTAFARWRLQRPLRAELNGVARRRRLVVKATTVLALIALILVLRYALALGHLEFEVLSSRMNPFIRAFQCLMLLVGFGTAYAGWAAWRAYLMREGSTLYRLGAAVVAVSLTIIMLFAVSYHAFSLRLNY